MSTQWQNLKPSDIASKEEQHALRQRSDAWGWYLLIHCWGMIAFAIALYAIFPSIVTLLLGIIIVGGRQLGLAILMHEGAHGMLFKTRKLNDTLTDWLIAAPMIIDMGLYRKRHMAHHRFTRTDADPENYLYTPFPVTKGSMARKLLRDLTGIAFLRSQLGLFLHLWGKPDGRLGRVWGYYKRPVTATILMALGFGFAGRLDLFLLLWLLPLATTQMAFLRVRNIAEHATMPDLEDPLRNSRTTLANFVERLTVAPYWVNFHIEHHLMPFIPCYRLPQLHALLGEKGYHPRMEIRDGYLDILKLNASKEAA